MEPLRTTSAVIDALGGTAAVSVLTGRSMQAVSNWRSREYFTASSYEAITRALLGIGRTADPSLWRTVPGSAVSGAAA